MENKLTNEDLDFILESLKYTKRNFRESQDHPNHEFKQSQLKRVDELADKIRAIKKNQ
jgi:hypothetical protein